MDHSQSLSYSFWKLDFTLPFDSNMHNCMYRWGLLESFKILKFRFNLEFQITSVKQFVESLMAIKAVQSLAGISHETIKDVGFVVKKCSLLNTNFLDRLEEHDIVGSDGYLRQIMPMYNGDFEVNTKLAQILSKHELEDEELLHLFDDIQDEFLFSLFSILVLGGKFNQFDDNIENYREITKQIYKGLVKSANKYPQKR